MASFNQEDLTAQFAPEDIEKNKTISAIAVFIPILFFLPLVSDSASKFGKFYANQGLILLVLGIAAGVVTTIIAIIPILGWILAPLINAVVYIFLFVCCIMGLLNALKGVAKRAPLVGFLDILK